MRPIRETITLEAARDLVDGAIRPIERTERVRIDTASGRVVARAVEAQTDVPPFARAAMDGYAVRAADTFGASTHDPRALTWVETVFTGQVPGRPVGAHQCTEIATGAPVPDGSDAVVMVEETEKQPDHTVRVFSPVYPGQNVTRQGADIRAGQAVLRPGDVLNPSRIGAVAALGIIDVEVYAQPRVAILSTGNEVVDPGQPLKPGHIYDINKFTLSTVLREHGACPVPYPTAPDNVPDLTRAIEACLAEDVILFSGGSSVGERDLILDVVERMGEVLFHGIAVKPGKPTLFGTIKGRPVFGMPGYPTSCLSNAYMLLIGPIRRLARLPEWAPRIARLPLGQRVVSTTGRHQFYTVRIVDGQAMPAFKASGDITSMSQADGYIEIPAQVDVVEKGEPVDVKLF
ncbi:MAG: molybdopterin-binding protein [Vicinamibacterales bacterium]|jgi:molybdenum cofactor synthesis domain-containing protein|nr:molybdopterin-binding protein [Vicinamibacterales bacterium]